ncbi:MAG: putative selenocysteine system protein [Promethearchaeota archaeon]
MENRLLQQFENVIQSQWLSQQITEPYDKLTPRELFELAYHTCNSVGTRAVQVKLSQDDKSGGSRALLYSKDKKFILIEALPDFLKITIYFNENSNAEELPAISQRLKERKSKFVNKEKDLKGQILKTILVERKLDECANLVMLKDINRKIYFAIGDARESAAVVPMFMEAEGSNLVQLALNKWMATAQRLPQEETFPENSVPGLLKNLMQIKKWTLSLISSKLDK